MENLYNYELLVIYELNYADSDLDTEVEKVNNYLKEKVQDLKIDVIGRVQFAYQIRKKSYGHYVVYYFKATPEFVFEELDQKLKLNESVMRFLIRNLDRTKYAIVSYGGEKVKVDYKNVDLLKQFLSEYNRILPRKVTGLRQKDQKKVAREIKIARNMALLPFVSECIEK